MTSTILIADDSQQIRRLVHDFLAEELDVSSFEEAENGEQAIAKARAVQPTVTILDFSMPVMSGLEAAPLLKRVAPHTRIILFTLFASAAPALPCDNIDAIVSKTEGLDKLTAQVRAFLPKAA